MQSNHNSSLFSKLKNKPLLPLFYNDSIDICLRLVDTVLSTGIKTIEFTNRGPNAKSNFQSLIQHLGSNSDVELGVGSIKNKQEAKDFIRDGAKFIVSPFLEKNIGNFCSKNQIPWIPGCGTLSEIIEAESYGAEIIKLFPGSVYGPKFISSVLGPCPWLKIMPTGGVTTEYGNMKKWMDSGAFCLGMGSKLFTKELILNENQNKLKIHILEILKNLESLK